MILIRDGFLVDYFLIIVINFFEILNWVGTLNSFVNHDFQLSSLEPNLLEILFNFLTFINKFLKSYYADLF